MEVEVENSKLIQVRNHHHRITVLVVEVAVVELDSLLEMLVYLHRMLLVVELMVLMVEQVR